MKILAVKLRAIGDTVIWTSALNALRAQFPQAEIHVLTYASNAAVFQNHPAVNKTHFLISKSSVALGRKLLGLRAEKFDWLLGFHATTSLCRWAWVAGASKMALHHHSRTQTPRGSVPIAEPGKLEDAISRDYQVLRAMGISPQRQPTSLHVAEAEAAAAESAIQSAVNAAGGDAGLPRFLFLPGASHYLRRYPKDLLLPLILKAKAGGRYQPVVVVDQEVSREWNLPEECQRAGIPLVDKSTLREFICLISRGQRALANDSGPGHIAVALGLSTDFVFGPGCAGDWHPYDRSINRLHRVAVDCRAQGPRDQEAFQFCTVESCSHHSCMRKLKLDISI